MKQEANNDALCACGCGAEVSVTINHHTRKPVRYIHGHNRRGDCKKERYAVDPKTGCWNWLLCKNANGYGQCARGDGSRRLVLAHRFTWESVNGPVPNELVLDHLCRNPACVNPAHLEAVPQSINMRRGKNTKLTLERVMEIREMRATGMKYQEIEKVVGIHHAHIWRIVNKQYWKDIIAVLP